MFWEITKKKELRCNYYTTKYSNEFFYISSIPQKIRNEAQKILKDVTKHVFLENIDDICNLFLSNLSSIFVVQA